MPNYYYNNFKNIIHHNNYNSFEKKVKIYISFLNKVLSNKQIIKKLILCELTIDNLERANIKNIINKLFYVYIQ